MSGNTLDNTETDSLRLPSPLQKLDSPLLRKADVELYVKRDDLIHPEFGGNKWRKLRYNLRQASVQNKTRLLTFGGAWSNHIYATAAAGKAYDFDTIGIIRGEKHSPLNSCLAFATDCGMRLHYVSRSDYRRKSDTDFIEQLQQRFGDFYLIPEGGRNTLALTGCRDIVDEITIEFDTLCCACGTGTTLAGIITALQHRHSPRPVAAIGFSALKAKGYMEQQVKALLEPDECRVSEVNWHIEDEFHFGGYAKLNDDLRQFMNRFQKDYGFELDAVYTAKMFYGLLQLIAQGRFHPGHRIIAVHSGGLQGNKGFNLSNNPD